MRGEINLGHLGIYGRIILERMPKNIINLLSFIMNALLVVVELATVRGEMQVSQHILSKSM
jgi:hypothetical protein